MSATSSVGFDQLEARPAQKSEPTQSFFSREGFSEVDEFVLEVMLGELAVSPVIAGEKPRLFRFYPVEREIEIMQASAEAKRKTFKRLVMKYHPDKCSQDKETCNTEMAKLSDLKKPLKTIYSYSEEFIRKSWNNYCDLQAHPEPVVYLCGEIHSDPNDIFFKGLMEETQSGRFVFAVEGLSRDKESERKWKELRSFEDESPFFGIEEHLLFTNAVSANLMLKKMQSVHQFHHTMRAFLDEKIANYKSCDICGGFFAAAIRSVLEQSNQDLLKDFWAHRQLNNMIFKELQIERFNLVELTLVAQKEYINRKMEEWTISDALQFTEAIALNLTENIKNNLSTEDQIEKMEHLSRCLNQSKNDRDCDVGIDEVFKNLMHILRITIGNHFISRSIEEIYEITKDLKKPIICIIGDDHVEGLREDLRSKGFAVRNKEEAWTKVHRFEPEWKCD